METGVRRDRRASRGRGSGAGRARPHSQRATNSLPALNRVALGFFETNANGRRVIAHLGDVQAFHTALHIIPGEKVGMYLPVNSGGANGASGQIRTAFFQDFSDQYYPATVSALGHLMMTFALFLYAAAATIALGKTGCCRRACRPD